jgi:hypothetical protein
MADKPEEKKSDQQKENVTSAERKKNHIGRKKNSDQPEKREGEKSPGFLGLIKIR